jgi:hypothetical protein
MLHLSPDHAFLLGQLHPLHFAAFHRLTESNQPERIVSSSRHIPGLALCLIWSCAVVLLLRTLIHNECLPTSDGVMPQAVTPKTIRPVSMACHSITPIRLYPAGRRSIIPIINTGHLALAQPP